jgi:integrase
MAASTLMRLSERASELPASGDGKSKLLFTSDGIRGLRVETASSLVNEIASEMLKSSELREGFQMRDLRRTCETMLAALSVSSDIRAQVQSHGLGGVQARHYDRHNYMAEKRATLEMWNQNLEALVSGRAEAIIQIRNYK